MSFYGNTYYQLVDAFGKILFKNKGGVLTDQTPEDGEAEAIGRKGIVELSTGNRWLNFSKEKDNSFVISHAKADTDNVTEQKNFEPVDTLPEEEIVTKLNYSDIIKVPSIKYDSAGHLIPGEDYYVELPPVSDTQAELETIEERTTDLEGRMTTAEDNIDTIESSINSLERNITTVSNSVGRIQNARDEFYLAGDEELNSASISDMLILLKEENDKLKASITTYDLAINSLKTLIDDLQGQIDELKNQ